MYIYDIGYSTHEESDYFQYIHENGYSKFYSRKKDKCYNYKMKKKNA